MKKLKKNIEKETKNNRRKNMPLKLDGMEDWIQEGLDRDNGEYYTPYKSRHRNIWKLIKWIIIAIIILVLLSQFLPYILSFTGRL